MSDFVSILRFLTLSIFKWILHLIDYWTQTFFGFKFISGTKEEQNRAKKYKNSAHRVKIIWRAKLYLLPSLNSFLYVHKEYFHPENIFELDNVTLFGLNKKNAFFSVIDPDQDIYDLKKFHFVCTFQWILAKELIILPIASFHRLAQKVREL